VLVNLAHRVQGLIVRPGNPKSISALGDLVRDDVTFVNRQRGSGTRMLLDHLLKGEGISHTSIRGYEREEYTHLAVAATVAGGRADVGVGVLSAARAMGMDFVELGTEQYDLVIPAEFYGSDLLAPLLDLIRTNDFRRQIDALGGYDTSQTGEVQAEL
jgi:putative molybdopterin biosynthesis protein